MVSNSRRCHFLFSFAGAIVKSHQGFDRLSGCYDFLTKLVFGKAMRKAQIAFIEKIGDGKHWLILGGGTGWILEEIFSLHPNTRITYVEASQKMINKAKKRILKGDVQYILGTIEQLPTNQSYDGVTTSFFWDMFSTSRALKMKALIDQQLKNKAIWLLTDFKNSNIWWQRGLLKGMYCFFRATCHIEAFELPDFDQIFNRKKHTILYQDTFYHEMIRSTLYEQKK